MTLDEAIQIKDTELEGTVEHSEEELCRAEMLCIEAGKARIRDRAFGYVDLDDLLPGETKD